MSRDGAVFDVDKIITDVKIFFGIVDQQPPPVVALAHGDDDDFAEKFHIGVGLIRDPPLRSHARPLCSPARASMRCGALGFPMCMVNLSVNACALAPCVPCADSRTRERGILLLEE